MTNLPLILRLAAAVLIAASFGPARDTEAISEVLNRAVSEKRIPGAVVLVKQRGKIVFEKAAGYADLESGRRMRGDDIFMIASSSKPFAASAIMALVEQGKIRLDDPVAHYLPAFQAKSTIRQLLSHTSGIFGNSAKPEQLESIRNFNRSLKDAVDLIVRQPLEYPPGEKYSYGGASFCVAGRIVEMLTGLEFDGYMQKVLLEPLELRETFYRANKKDVAGRLAIVYSKTGDTFTRTKAIMEPPNRPGPRSDGFIRVPGGIYSTARDAAAFLEMHLNQGMYNGKRILSEPAVREMRTKQTGTFETAYGLGWQLSRLGTGGEALSFGHGGAYGTELWVDLEKKLVGVIFTQMPMAQARPFLTEIKECIERTIR
jgi:CubicO group peptidase (beta-lactamase class C family)